MNYQKLGLRRGWCDLLGRIGIKAEIIPAAKHQTDACRKEECDPGAGRDGRPAPPLSDGYIAEYREGCEPGDD